MAVVNYDWDDLEDNIVEEYDDSGNTIAEYTTEPSTHGNVISQYRNGQESFYHSDGQGSTLALTNSAGDVTDAYAYNAFGEATARTGDTVNPFQFIGQKGYYHDAETGTLEVRRRPLLGEYGRWMSVDPLQLLGFPNFYNYVLNRTTMLRDPSGLKPEDDPGCCECKSLASRLTDPTGRKIIRVQRTDKFGKIYDYECRIGIDCKPGIAACEGSPAKTDKPFHVNRKGVKLHSNIQICVSCAFEQLDILIAHEMEHARQFCIDPNLANPQSCPDCKTKKEGPAHEVSCNMQEWATKEDRDRCIACGTLMSCKKECLLEDPIIDPVSRRVCTVADLISPR